MMAHGRNGEALKHVRLLAINNAFIHSQYTILSLSPLHAAELIMVERDGCAWCVIWQKQIAPIYPKTDIGKKLPLKTMNIADNFKEYSLKSPVRYTPTFLIIENKIEIGRIEGYASEDFFWSRLELLAK
jgi:thioredoxin-related protein